MTALRYRVLVGSKEGDTQRHTAGAGRDGAGRQSRWARPFRDRVRAESVRESNPLKSRTSVQRPTVP